MKQGTIALVVIVILAIGGWAIFGKNDNNTKPSTANTNHTSNTSQTNNSAKTQTPASTNSVTIQNFAFSPASITVKKGTTVTWTNKDGTQHDVVENDGQDGPKSKLLAQGESYSFTFNTVGSFKYICSIHPHMTGGVTVTE